MFRLFQEIFLLTLVFIASGKSDRSNFAVQTGTPVYIKNFVQTYSGCNWMGIGGQVFDQQGQAVAGLLIRVSGAIERKQIVKYGITGGSVSFGQGGYDIKLADKPVASRNQFTLTVFELSGNQLSNSIQFSTKASCEKNLIIINLIEAP